jgi:hypothetical protein
MNPYLPEQLRTLAIGGDAPAGDGWRIVVVLRFRRSREVHVSFDRP